MARMNATAPENIVQGSDGVSRPPVAARRSLWQRYREMRVDVPEVGLSLDCSRAGLDDGFLEEIASDARRAIDAMAALEAGAIANVDERRMVGHYWLRAPELAPSAAIREELRAACDGVCAFAARVHAGEVRGTDGRFEHVLHVGVGGSATGAQLICGALADADDPIAVHFVDNADPDGIDRTLARLDGALGRTLTSVVSKSGWTPTPLHGMRELESAYRRAGLDFDRHAIATTMADSQLDALARERGWLERFPLWEWVGGRTSATSAVGLLPAALQGADVGELLAGARAMDDATRELDLRGNAALLLALAWHALGRGRGERDMVVVPYKDRLAGLVRYVQQLVMESLGKRLDRGGAIAQQGLTVYGGRGSCDQHAYFQQLFEGAPDFFVTFVLVGEDRRAAAIEVEPGLTLGDFLFGYAEGTRNALYEAGRESVTIGVRSVSARSLGALIALFERAVGIYAELIDVNAYNQPSVAKDAARPVVELQRAVTAFVAQLDEPQTADAIAEGIGRPEEVETVFKLLDRLARDYGRGIAATSHGSQFSARFGPTQSRLAGGLR
jgi:glucose-6-phosphate isomerase